MDIDTRKIRLILRKEWLEMKQQRALVLGMVFLPLLFTILPLGLIFLMGQLPAGEMNGVDALFELVRNNPALQGLSEQELVQVIIGQPISTILFILPVMLPSIIASYSIVGEKVSRTLEPVLATPVTTLELLLAKMLSALIPSVGFTWLAGAVFLTGMVPLSLSHSVFVAIISPSWFLLMLLCAPLLALLAIAATVTASSRVNDPRSAQQISAVVILPVVLLIAGQFTGLLSLSPLVSLIVAAILALIAAALTWLATRVFQREAILTRWS
jgi:ABC-2 type transport system permease protein